MKLITTEVLILEKINVPVITGIYDPLSKKRDGTITSRAPIVVSGRNLNMLDLGDISLCLVCSLNTNLVIDVCNVHRYSTGQVIVSLPPLMPGEYFPAMKIHRERREDWLYVFPVSWVVESG